jgi:hypothetical protein
MSRVPLSPTTRVRRTPAAAARSRTDGTAGINTYRGHGPTSENIKEEGTCPLCGTSDTRPQAYPAHLQSDGHPPVGAAWRAALLLARCRQQVQPRPPHRLRRRELHLPLQPLREGRPHAHRL